MIEMQVRPKQLSSLFTCKKRKKNLGALFEEKSAPKEFSNPFTDSMPLLLKETERTNSHSTTQAWMTSSHSVEKGTQWLSVCGWTTQRMTST